MIRRLEAQAAATLGLDEKTANALFGQARAELGRTSYTVRLLAFLIATSRLRAVIPQALRQKAIGAFLAGVVATAADVLAYLGLAPAREQAAVARGLLPP